MAETEEAPGPEAADAPKKRSKLPMILGLALALAGGGGGFYAAYSGMIPFGDSHGADGPGDAHDEAGGHGEGGAAQSEDLPDIAFVPVEPMVISLGAGADMQHLRFRAQLEVPSAHRRDVETLLPRVVDVLNSYLRALELSDIADAAALVRLRAQMLRRIQIVTGADRVNDLLIMEFVLN